MSSGTERRAQKRIPAKVAVSVSSGREKASTGKTRDLSTSGIFLYTSKQVSQGNLLELVLMLPPEFTDGQKKWICCEAEVVRVEDDKTNEFGIAARIMHITPLPEIPSEAG